MKAFQYLVILTLIQAPIWCQENTKIVTSDIDNFWKAYDLLSEAETRADSIQVMQTHYIEKASDGFKEFLRVRNFTAEEYVQKLGLYPKFWASVRPLTEAIENRRAEIIGVFNQYEAKVPDFKRPEVCFAIGGLRTGGTISGNLILIGSEIAASDTTIDKSELKGWLSTVIGNTGDITAMIAHETIHVLQFNKRKFNLIIGVMSEGIADFLAIELLGFNINKPIYDYGDAHECDLWKAFKQDMIEHPDGHRRWLYQGNRSGNRPADLGYYLGFKVAQAYYEKQPNKRKAIKDLLNVKKYPKIIAKSGYTGGCK